MHSSLTHSLASPLPTAVPSPDHPDIIPAERKLAAVGHLLQRRHAGHYMVWNLSEVEYNSEILEDQVLTYSFPGSPSPPLGLWLKLLVAMESWLSADPRNVAVVHCLTGKGRTSLVLAAFLAWMGEAGFTSDLTAALQYIADCKHVPADQLTIPSQRRYATYFQNMLDGVRPSQPPVVLQRIVFSHAPTFCSRIDAGTGNPITGCVPYIQIFKAGELLHTVPATAPIGETTALSATEVPFCSNVASSSTSSAHGGSSSATTTTTVRFDVNIPIQGDILVRARHLAAKRKRVSMFRVAFHTGYAPATVMRLTRSQLDGACDDDEQHFPADFFVDLIFAASGGEEQEAGGSGTATATSPPTSPTSAAVRAAPEDAMLHRDSRFWDVIAARVKANTTTSDATSMEGPTVGKRRGAKTQTADNTNEQDTIDPFQIGGESTFLPDEEPTPPTSSVETTPPATDSLMEALMGALDDSGGNEEEEEEDVTEEIVFDNASDTESLKTSDGSAVVVHVPEEEAAVANDSSTEPMTKASDTNKLSDAVDLLALDDEDDDDLNALLAGTEGVGLSDDDLLNLDVDDPDLDDLESFLAS